MDYVTVIEPVLELSLIGETDFAAWAALFQDEKLPRIDKGDSIELILSAVQARYMGLLFREFSISLRLTDTEFFLAHAYNSRRSFAFAERNFFQTPYYFADISVQPRQIGVSNNRASIFSANLPETSRKLSQADEVAEYQIWLPRKLRKQADRAHYFHARLEGTTAHYEPQSVQIAFGDTTGEPIFNLLRQANFRVKDCLLRDSGRHSKSKTMLV